MADELAAKDCDTGLTPAIQRSYLGQAAMLVHKVTGLPPRASVLAVGALAAWTAYQHGTFPTVDFARATAQEAAATDLVPLQERLTRVEAQLRDSEAARVELVGEVSRLRRQVQRLLQPPDEP